MITIYGLALVHGNYLSMDLTVLVKTELRIMFSTRGRKWHFKNVVRQSAIFTSVVGIISLK